MVFSKFRFVMSTIAASVILSTLILCGSLVYINNKYYKDLSFNQTMFMDLIYENVDSLINNNNNNNNNNALTYLTTTIKNIDNHKGLVGEIFDSNLNFVYQSKIDIVLEENFNIFKYNEDFKQIVLQEQEGEAIIKFNPKKINMSIKENVKCVLKFKWITIDNTKYLITTAYYDYFYSYINTMRNISNISIAGCSIAFVLLFITIVSFLQFFVYIRKKENNIKSLIN